MFSTEERKQLQNNQLSEVICQLRFPEILKISASAPVDFQESVRGEFPNYSARQALPPPKITGVPGHFSLENIPPKTHYQFSSVDRIWQISLSSNSISLTCKRYTCWEDFAIRLDKPLAAFIQCYDPAYFQRIGLRYVNVFSRKQLELSHVPFSSLFQPQYLGPLSEEDVPETTVLRSSVDTELVLRGGCRAKIHAGPGFLKTNTPTETEVKFIFDQDLFMAGNIPTNHSAGALQTIHSHAFSIFRGAITDILYEALEPNSY